MLGKTGSDLKGRTMTDTQTKENDGATEYFYRLCWPTADEVLIGQPLINCNAEAVVSELVREILKAGWTIDIPIKINLYVDRQFAYRTVDENGNEVEMPDMTVLTAYATKEADGTWRK